MLNTPSDIIGSFDTPYGELNWGWYGKEQKTYTILLRDNRYESWSILGNRPTTYPQPFIALYKGIDRSIMETAVEFFKEDFLSDDPPKVITDALFSKTTEFRLKADVQK
jgi:hypothetical protein